MQKIVLFVCSLTVWFYSLAQDNYAVDLIPAQLLIKADAVKRSEEMRIDISEIGKATIYHKYAITILNEAGDEYADFNEYYDKLHSLKYVEGRLFNAAGKKIKTMKKADLTDLSLSTNANSVDDTRLKTHNFYNKLYPYTIEYESSVDLNGIFYFPDWTPAEGVNFAVQNSTLRIECPNEYVLRYKAFNYNGSPLISETGKTKIYQWTASQLPAISKEKYSLNWYELTTAVFLAPTDFEIEDYTGKMTTWKDFGDFLWKLNADRRELPDNIKKTVHDLTDHITDEREKINVLYKFLQKNTRYVSIQLGIGGWQTLQAGYVAEKGYGDCKALSNYMVALLNAAGIKAEYTLIKAGNYRTDFRPDFPSNQFNHIIVCVPMPKDSVWLECTSQTLPAGYLSSFTSNRPALLIDADGGKLVYTPKYKLEDNLQIRKINASVNAEGDLNATINTQYKAEQQDYLHGMINALSKDKILERLKSTIELPTYDIVKFDYKEDPNTIPSVYENLELTATNYAQVSGKRLFLNPNVLSRSSTTLSLSEDRKTDIKFNYSFSDADTIEIKIPSGYKPESQPAKVSIDNKFGKYSSEVKITDDHVTYYRLRQQFAGVFPAKDYKELATFFDQMNKADHTKIVLIKTTE